jgi:glycosyltransferase involved in cell wall biosynthesis
MTDETRQAPRADIALLLEGTFPYVRGGVSAWVNQIILGFPEYRFSICFIGSRRNDYEQMHYRLPPNVVHFEEHYLHDESPSPPPRRRRCDSESFAYVMRMHEGLRCPATGHKEEFLSGLMRHVDAGRLEPEDFLYSRESWEYITAQYRRFCTDPSFVDYFWTVRVMHRPLWMLLNIARRFPPAQVYHTISTGYAGFLGALLRRRTGQPLLVSEHGIYTKERRIDLFQAEWVRDNRGILERNGGDVPYFRELWIRFFESLGRQCYDNAARIVALFEANRLRQIADGAAADRTENIPNGVDVERLHALRARRTEDIPPVACLLGRVVPVKDVKTFIRSMRTVLARLPHAEGWIVGPEDEDAEYAAECHKLVSSLGLDGKVRFLGFQNVDDVLPQVGVVVLSSISEALPLVVLEGFAAGVPCVVTDVGSCRQLVEGLEGADRELGAAGEVVGIANAEQLGRAVVRLLDDPERWQRAQAAGIARVERYYRREQMFERYRELYRQTMGAMGEGSRA